MSFFEGTIFSQTLCMMTSLSVSIPSYVKQDAAGYPDMPVLYLLHGLSDNHTNWMRRTNVDYYAELAGIAVVMPEVQRSFYTDMAHGLRYFSYIAEELPQICRKMFRFSDRREDNFIAGLSMGGYGALKTALRFPERFASVGSFSGAVDIKKRCVDGTELMSHDECFAINKGHIQPDDDLFCLAEKIAENKEICPNMYITCGFSDFMYEDNKRFQKHLESLELPHIFEEWPGDHEWAFWDKSVKTAIDYFTKGFPDKKER